jgi:lipopolysaccharide/colanic/teichoic acid biosynthesis glycosyltransferase
VRTGIPHAIEVLVALIGLVLATPILLLAAIAVRLSSSGPIIFRQQRIGQGGRPFTLFKFCTMRQASDGTAVTARGDRRVTAVGEFLRMSKIDELPELWNIVIGDMSIVGPRPEVTAFVDLENPLWSEVLRVRPGITDPITLRLRNEEALLARVPNAESFYLERLQPLKLRGYLKYLRQRNAWRDIQVIATTVLASVFPKSVPAPTVREILASMESSVLEEHDRQAVSLRTIQIRLLQFAIDISLLAASLVASYELRYDFNIPQPEITSLELQLPIVIVLQVALLSAVGAFRFVWRYVGIADIKAFARAFTWSVVLLLALRFGLTARHHELQVPFSIVVIDAILAFGSIAGVRLLRRIHYEKMERLRRAAWPRRERSKPARNVLLVGAGRGGILAAKEIAGRGDLDINLVGFVDDDSNKQGAVIQGVRVLGTTEDLPRLIREREVDQLIVTIADRSSDFGTRIHELCAKSGVDVLEIPGLFEIIRGKRVIPR